MKLTINLFFCTSMLLLSGELVYEIPILLLLAPFYLHSITNTSSKATIEVLILIFLLILWSGLNQNNYKDYYLLWLPLAIINVHPSIKLFKLIQGKSRLPSFIQNGGLFILLILAFSASLSEARRFTIGFGPNMYYRFILFFTVILKLFSNNSRFRNIIIYSLSFYIIVRTGSRGGLLSYIFLITAELIFNYRKKHFSRITIISIVTIIVAMITYFIYSNYELIRQIFGRVFYLDLTNRSEAYRLGSMLSYIDWLNLFSYDFYFGSGYLTKPFEYIYPHNILVEAHHSFGFMVLTIIIFLIGRFVLSYKNEFWFKTLLIIFPFLIGSFLSGSLLDNFSIISLLLAFNYITSDKNRINVGI